MNYRASLNVPDLLGSSRLGGGGTGGSGWMQSRPRRSRAIPNTRLSDAADERTPDLLAARDARSGGSGRSHRIHVHPSPGGACPNAGVGEPANGGVSGLLGTEDVEGIRLSGRRWVQVSRGPRGLPGLGEQKECTHSKEIGFRIHRCRCPTGLMIHDKLQKTNNSDDNGFASSFKTW